ncbi:MAG: hypothetical protein IJ464_05015 [Alistipes sp.]|nr:hypothetical protein [Alistipes sp.]
MLLFDLCRDKSQLFVEYYNLFGCRNEENDAKIALARAMREEGKTLQEIADTLGYKSRSTVINLLRE